MEILPDRSYAAPRTFHVYRYGFRHVITDVNGGYVASGVPIDAESALSAGPELLAALECVADLTIPGAGAREAVADAMVPFREREGMVLADWKSEPETESWPPKLRIVGVVGQPACQIEPRRTQSGIVGRGNGDDRSACGGPF